MLLLLRTKSIKIFPIKYKQQFTNQYISGLLNISACCRQDQSFKLTHDIMTRRFMLYNEGDTCFESLCPGDVHLEEYIKTTS